jgi:hypothetical protein
MLHHSGLSEGFWAEALLTALHIINISPSSLLDQKFRKRFGHYENRIMESCAYSDARRTYLCQGTSVVNSSHGHGNIFSSDMDLTEVSAIDYGTRRLTKLSEVWTWSSTSP